MKIVILDGYTLASTDLNWDGFNKLGDVKYYDRTDSKDTIKRIGDAEIVITNKTAITKEVLDSCKNIKYIGVLATGYNVVDFLYAKEKGIPVCNVPTYGTTAVAQYVFALLLEICHHVGHHDKVVKEGKWTSNKDFCFWDYPLIELKGKTIGIIGIGRIGEATARIAKAFGLEVIAYDKYFSSSAREVAEEVSLDELYSRADIISLHCPLFKENEKMINAESIAKMKDGVIIINTSRGGLINEKDTKVALDSGKISFLACDVVSTEPIQKDNPLLEARNCIITPHIAWAPKESRQRLMDVAVDNVKAFIEGRVQNKVN